MNEQQKILAWFFENKETLIVLLLLALVGALAVGGVYNMLVGA